MIIDDLRTVSWNSPTRWVRRESPAYSPFIDSFPLDKLLGSLHEDWMDILDTLIRTILNESQLPFAPALTLLREWEALTRTQLAGASGPGQLFSPIDLPEGF